MTTLGMRSKPRMLKRMLVLLALSTIGALTSVTAQAQIVTNETVSSAYSGYVPCANGGAGELVAGRIDVHNLVTRPSTATSRHGSSSFSRTGAWSERSPATRTNSRA